MKKGVIKQLILTGGVNDDEYPLIKPAIHQTNYKTWRIFSIIAEVIFLTLLLFSVFIDEFFYAAPFFGILVAFFMVTSLLFLGVIKAESKHLNALILTSNLVILTVTLLCSFIADAFIFKHVGFYFGFVLLLFASLNLDRPIRLAIIALSYSLVYIIGGAIINHNLGFSLVENIYNVIINSCFLLITLFLCFFIPNVRFKYYQSLFFTQQERDIDALTGVKNSIAYRRVVDDISDALKRNDTIHFTVFVFDVNKLKETNDLYGHSYGDELLVRSARLIGSLFPNIDVFRTGGDEFTVILRDNYSMNAFKYEETVKNKLEDIKRESTLLLNETSIAFGCATYDPKVDNDYIQVYSKADALMYENKNLSKKDHK